VRIAIVVNTSWNIFNFRSGLVRALQAQGAEVLAIAPPDAYSDRLRQMGCLYLPVQMANKGTNPIEDLKLVHQLYRHYKKYKPDVVLHFTIKPNIYGTLAARLAGVPVINNVSGLGTVFLHQNLTAFIAKKLYRWAFRYANYVFFQNQEDRDLFLELGLAKSTQAVLVPGSGVDTQKFIPAVTFSAKKAFTFLMVARLLYDKGIVEYIGAIRKMKAKGAEAVFQLVGAVDESASLGVSRDTVREWEQEGLVEYLGFTDDLLRLYQEADCVVLPSYREGTPRSLLEAGACARPLVATNVPGCKEVVVEGSNGFLCRAKDTEDLATAMTKMLTLSPDQRHQMGQFSRTYILKKFDENIVLNTYFKYINSILGRPDKFIKSIK
jgi:glycosyltransferase involved in cell wall biosynthesis